jgi:WD40 repeat protein
MGQNEKPSKDNREQSVAEILEQAKSHKSRRYQSQNLIDRTLHSGPIRNINYSPLLDLVYVIEMGSKVIKLYDTKCEIKATLGPDFKDDFAGNRKKNKIPMKDDNFVLGADYNERDRVFLISASNKYMYPFMDDTIGSFTEKKKFKASIAQTSVWYFERHDAWVSAGMDHKLRRWDIKNGVELMTYGAGHKEQIMDAVEIRVPLCVATAGHDGSIFIWELGQQAYTRRLHGKHRNGIRSLDYSPDNGGNLVSVGYEKHVNVWSPGISLSDQCYTGKLEGHSCPVVSCKFFIGRPTCVSVDEKSNVRLWDIRYQQCLQIITHDRGKVEVSNLITLSRHDKIVVGGKRL